MGEERETKTKEDGTKKQYYQVSRNISNGGGNGIAGLLVLGGAMAVAGYVALSSLHSLITNRSKAKAKSAVIEPEPKPQQLSVEDGCKSQDHGDHQTESTPNSDGNAVSACHVTSYMIINQALILEGEKTDSDLNTSSEVVSPNSFHHQEIVLYDNSHPESAASSSSNENEIEEECLAVLFDNSTSQTQEDGPQQSLDSMQPETKDYDILVIENGKEDSSKAIEGTSLNSNEDKAEQDLKGEEGTTEFDIQTHEAAEMDISTYDDASLFAGTNMAVNVTPEATSNEKENLSVGLNYQPSPSHSFQLITLLMPMLLQALLLVLVLFTCTTSFYVLHQVIP